MVKTPLRTTPKFLSNLLWWLLYLLPAILFFSYYPVISLGSNNSMNFELSLPLLWLVLFDLTSFITLLLLNKTKLSGQGKSQPHMTSWGPNFSSLSDKRFFLFSLFPLYATFSIFWSENLTRAVLTAGVLWLVFFAVFSILFVMPLLLPRPDWRRNLLRSLFISTAFVCIFCWAQCLLDLAGLPRGQTLLCAGCTSQTFGFPHPSGFAIEPQFMGNLLLAPTLLILFLLAFRQDKVERRNNVTYLLLACLFSATLFLTLSRGAIYAYAVALLVLFIFALSRHAKWHYIVVVPVVTFFFTLAAQGIFTAVGPTSDTFYSGVSKVIHQLSLGIIDIRPAEPEPAASSVAPTSDGNSGDNEAIFDGYVAASTNIRLNLNRAALQTWLSSPKNAILGAGLGGAGTALYLNSSITGITSPKEIVQNEPLSLLLELGLVGAILVIFSLLLAFFAPIFPRRFLDGRAVSETIKAPEPAKTHKSSSAASPKSLKSAQPLKLRLRRSVFWSHPALPLLLALILAYFITLNFFSGLPNALHIYLLPPLLFLIFSDSPHHLLDD